MKVPTTILPINCRKSVTCSTRKSLISTGRDFILKNGDKEELILGPYVGAATDHTVIPFGKGICGQVAVSNQTFVVPDVHEQDNYLSCSIDTKAEIVVPIIKNGENIGQIDIDSHTLNPFTQEDREMLEWLCGEVAGIL